VWRDVGSIAAGDRWFDAIQKGIRGSHGLVVLVTPASAESEWVTYEYALARGARVPVVAVRVDGARVPKPIRNFQVVEYSSNAKQVAGQIDEGILDQARSAAKQSTSAPTLLAKFQEVNGEIVRFRRGKRAPELGIDLWVEKAPKQTRRVEFEIPDRAFKDREWAVNRRKGKTGVMREFLTDEVKSYGDVEIWARGIGPGAGTWSTNSPHYKALRTHYRAHPTSEEIRRGLNQIWDN